MKSADKKIIKFRKRKWFYKRCLACALVLTCLSLAGVWTLSVYNQIPGDIKIKLGEELVWNIELPIAGEIVKAELQEEKEAVAVNGQSASNIPAGSIHIDLSEPVTMHADSLSSYQMNLKLFGIIPFKQVSVNVIENKTLTPVGLPIGIYLKTEGVLIIGVGDYIALDGSKVSPSEYVLKSGDYILGVNGEEISDKNTFIRLVEESGGESLVLTIQRNGEKFDVKTQPVQNQNGEYKLGIWVRDNAQGVGTMTFVDSNGNFGALGHGITDVDTSLILQLDGGTLYKTEIISIRKGTKGDPGEMTGMIEYSDRNILGDISANTDTGIFGVCNEKMLEQIENEALPIGLKQEIEIGPAQILCTVDGEPAYYDIAIKEVHLDGANVNKGITLEVTDEELIAITGGIVQGMSGAPIIQNGKLIGAVTHVCVNL